MGLRTRRKYFLKNCNTRKARQRGGAKSAAAKARRAAKVAARGPSYRPQAPRRPSAPPRPKGTPRPSREQRGLAPRKRTTEKLQARKIKQNALRATSKTGSLNRRTMIGPAGNAARAKQQARAAARAAQGASPRPAAKPNPKQDATPAGKPNAPKPAAPAAPKPDTSKADSAKTAATTYTGKADGHSKSGRHEEAAEAHTKAAESHEAAAQAYKSGDPPNHAAAAASHAAASKSHEAASKESTAAKEKADKRHEEDLSAVKNNPEDKSLIEKAQNSKFDSIKHEANAKASKENSNKEMAHSEAQAKRKEAADLDAQGKKSDANTKRKEADALDKKAEGHKKAADGHLKRAAQAKKRDKSLLSPALATLGGPASMFGSLANSIAAAVKEFAKALAAMLSAIGAAISAALQALADALGALGQALADLLSSLFGGGGAAGAFLAGECITPELAATMRAESLENFGGSLNAILTADRAYANAIENGMKDPICGAQQGGGQNNAFSVNNINNNEFIKHYENSCLAIGIAPPSANDKRDANGRDPIVNPFNMKQIYTSLSKDTDTNKKASCIAAAFVLGNVDRYRRIAG